MKENYMEINIEETITRLNTNEDMVKRLIKMALNNDELEKAQQAFATSNLEEAQRSIHTIKGTAANVGLVGLSKLALEIELKIKENGFLDFDLLNVMKDVWEDLKKQYE